MYEFLSALSIMLCVFFIFLMKVADKLIKKQKGMIDDLTKSVENLDKAVTLLDRENRALMERLANRK